MLSVKRTVCYTHWNNQSTCAICETRGETPATTPEDDTNTPPLSSEGKNNPTTEVVSSPLSNTAINSTRVAVDSMTTIDIDHISENNPPMQKVSVAAAEPTIIENLIVTISNLTPYSGEEFHVEGPVISPVINEVPHSALVEIDNIIDDRKQIQLCDDNNTGSQPTFMNFFINGKNMFEFQLYPLDLLIQKIN